jgi:hypothetical protein
LRNDAQIFRFAYYFSFGLVPKLTFPPIGLSGAFPELMRADSDLLFHRLFHFCCLSWKRGPVGGE